MIRQSPPLHVWTRHHPLPNAIARKLTPDLLRLRSSTLVRDIRGAFGVSTCTAQTAVAIARKSP